MERIAIDTNNSFLYERVETFKKDKKEMFKLSVASLSSLLLVIFDIFVQKVPFLVNLLKCKNIILCIGLIFFLFSLILIIKVGSISYFNDKIYFPESKQNKNNVGHQANSVLFL